MATSAEAATIAAVPTPVEAATRLVGRQVAELDTPVLLLDLDAFERNIGEVAGYLADHGVASEPILKMHEGRPNIADAIKNGEIQLVVNTPAGKLSVTEDSYIRKAAIRYKIPYITTTAAATAAARGIAARREGGEEIRNLQEYHASIG